MFSIVVVVKNNAEGLRRTLTSVFRQNISKDKREIIVIDAESTDNTQDVLRDHVPDILVSEQDKGIYDAMNKGLSHSTRTWVYFLNGGDVLASDTILQEVYDEVLSIEKRHSILCAPIKEVYETTHMIRGTRTVEQMPIHMPAGHQGMLIRTEVHKKHRFDIAYKNCADLDLVARLLQEGHAVYYLDRVLAEVEGEGQSNRQWRRTLVERKRIQKHYYPSMSKSFLFFLYSVNLCGKKALRFLLPKSVHLVLRKAWISLKKRRDSYENHSL